MNLDMKAIAAVNPSLPAFWEEMQSQADESKMVDDDQQLDQPRMEGVDAVGMFGRLGVASGWNAPLLVNYCDAEARPGYQSMKAHEYKDDPETLRAKVKMLAEMIRGSKRLCTYTGAGISTASGINDYASSKSATSVATGSKATGRPAKKTGLNAQPTFAHFALTALHRAGFLKHWVQQNHDGLPQKAGFPQESLNEVHGAWFDPSNPVVPMSGSLRDDLLAWLAEEEESCDLVLTMGTSLCGMNADRMVETPSINADMGVGLGSVIINFQRTQMDEMASLRIFGNIDEVMLLLAVEMELEVSCQRYQPVIPKKARVSPHCFSVPYSSKTGKRFKNAKTPRTQLNLAVGAKVMLTAGPGKGFKGKITRAPVSNSDGSYTVQMPCTREGPNLGKGGNMYALGSWWVQAACNGTVPLIPLINC